jgi:hypothetical protein
MGGVRSRFDQRALAENVQVTLKAIGLGVPAPECSIDPGSQAGETSHHGPWQAQRRVDRRDDRLPIEIAQRIFPPVLGRETDGLRTESLFRAFPPAPEDVDSCAFASCVRGGNEVVEHATGRATDCTSRCIWMVEHAAGGCAGCTPCRNEIVEHARRRRGRLRRRGWNQILEHAASQARRIDAVVAQALDHHVARRAASDRVTGLG